MTNAIATQLKSILDRQSELIELGNADDYWQKQLNKAVIIGDAPLYLVFPSNIETLAQIVTQAAQNRWRILICGNGSKLNWGKTANNIQLVVSLQKCARLIEHAVGDLTVTVEAGMKLADLQAVLRSHEQFLPLDPSYPDAATIGGIVATADAGSWRQRYGGVRDLLLGLSFVRADGAVAKAGGRVVKNVAGYDLMKLFTGAYGTLGIISQLTLRTYPLVKSSATMLLTGEASNMAQATQNIRNSGLTPTVLDLLSATVLQQLKLDAEAGLLIRWQTIPESITQQQAAVTAIALQLNLSVNNYQDRGETELHQRCTMATTKPSSNNAVTCKFGILPTAAVNFLQLEQVAKADVAVRIHAGSGVGTLQLNNADEQLIAQMRSHCQQNSGFLTVLDAPPVIKAKLDIWGYQGNALKTMQTIKNQFDPDHILNCDRFIV